MKDWTVRVVRNTARRVEHVFPFAVQDVKREIRRTQYMRSCGHRLRVPPLCSACTRHNREQKSVI